MSVQIKSGSGSNVVDVDINKSLVTTSKDSKGNRNGYGHRELIPVNQEYQVVAGKNDQFATALRTDRKGNIIMGNSNPELVEQFSGTTLNISKWTATVSAFVQVQNQIQGYVFANTGSTSSGAHSNIISNRFFQRMTKSPVYAKLRARHSAVAQSTVDFGFGIPATNVAIPADGVFFRFNSSGTAFGVIAFNGAEIAIDTIKSQTNTNGNVFGADLNMSNSYYTSNSFVYDLNVDDDNAVFTIQDTETQEMIGMLSLQVPKSTPKILSSTALPFYLRVFNNSSTASSPIFIVSELSVYTTDWNNVLDASQTAGNLHLSSSRHPYTGGGLENFTNNTTPTSATLSNTAAGYTTLGGKFQFAAVAAASTDYALFAYQVPTTSRFLCESIKIETYNTGAASATTNTLLEWGLGVNGSAVSLATGNIIRNTVGIQSIPVGSPIGYKAETVSLNFTTPEVAESGRFVHVILQMPVGTATASQIIRGMVTITGRFF